MVSHRSGETEDTTIADLAVGTLGCMPAQGFCRSGSDGILLGLVLFYVGGAARPQRLVDAGADHPVR